MAYVYSVQTNKGAVDVTTSRRHDHMSKADFERLLMDALLKLGTGYVLHRYVMKGQR